MGERERGEACKRGLRVKERGFRGESEYNGSTCRCTRGGVYKEGRTCYATMRLRVRYGTSTRGRVGIRKEKQVTVAET